MKSSDRLFSVNVVLFSLPYRADCSEREVGKDAACERVKKAAMEILVFINYRNSYFTAGPSLY